MIGDLLLLFGLPSVVTGCIWFLQKLTGRLTIRAKYLRRRIFGALIIALLCLVLFGFVVTIVEIANMPSGSNSASSLGSGIAMFIILEIPVIYWYGSRTEDGFLRAVFVPFSSLTPQAKERLVSGKLLSDNKSSQ